MKKLSMILMLAFVCGSFAMAQTSNVGKKATLMPDGAAVTDIRTGEVIRTTGAPIPADQLQINGSTTLSISGSPSNVTPLQRIKPLEDQPVNELITQPGAPGSSEAGGLMYIKPADAGVINTLTNTPPVGSAPQGGSNVITPNVNPKSSYTISPN